MIDHSLLGGGRQSLLSGRKTFHPVRFAFNHEFYRMMHQAIHRGGTHERIRKDAGPFAKVPV